MKDELESRLWRSRALAVLAIALLPASAAVAATMEPASVPSSPPAEIRRLLVALDTVLELRITAVDRATALRESEKVLSAFAEVEEELSVWRGESALSRLNRSPVGELLPLPAAVVEGLERVLACSERTRGAFDPTLGAARGEPAYAIEGATTARRLLSAPLDSGAFLKGEALDRAIERLREGAAGEATLDLGGQVSFYSAQDRGRRFPIEIADPRDRARPALRVSVPAGSVATSGQGVRGKHVVDPVSGEPVGDFGSVTAIVSAAGSQHPGFWADCLATGLFALGPEAALEVASTMPAVEVVVITKSGEGLVASVSHGLRDSARPLLDATSLRVFQNRTMDVGARDASLRGD